MLYISMQVFAILLVTFDAVFFMSILPSISRKKETTSADKKKRIDEKGSHRKCFYTEPANPNKYQTIRWIYAHIE